MNKERIKRLRNDKQESNQNLHIWDKKVAKSNQNQDFWKEKQKHDDEEFNQKQNFWNKKNITKL